MAEWQPIETAPQDGTRILVFTVHGDIEISEWYTICIFDPPTEGWNSNEPTHWMPLPEPPK